MSEKIPVDNIKEVNFTEKMLNDTEIITEKRYRGARGPDKKPRKINLNSIQNLKQYKTNLELRNEIITKNVKTTSFPSKLLVGTLIFVLILLLGVIIWRIYKVHIENRSK